MLVDLLAAVPSVVYGLWGVYVLIPHLKGFQHWLASTFSFLPFWATGGIAGPSYFIGGLILAIMILPIVSAISREVLATVPAQDKEAALALGATRWEMLKLAVLPYSRPGITGGAMLGLGRAIGETIAVVLVIGNSPQLGHTIFGQGYTLAAVIANEFGEAASTPVHRSALFAAGLVLFVLTLVVNIFARRFVVRGVKGRRTAGAGRGRASAWCGGRGMIELPQISARRRRTDIAMRGLLGAATIVALIPLVLIVYFLLHKGLGAWSGHFFSSATPTAISSATPAASRSAILGTLEIVGLATLISVPLGIGVALWLTEYGKASWFANVVRYFVDVMTGVPVDRVRAVRLRRARARRSRGRLHRLEGRRGAGITDAADRDPLLGGRAAARPLETARGGAGARRPPLAGDHQRSAAVLDLRPGHRRAARRSLAAPARPRRCCSPRSEPRSPPRTSVTR